ncbi:hypothetical protein [Paenibacillus arenilitoris]|uniref:Uncharacterized protein n=1 Tax=Paenibacillus arenilitoris TaxID=2772299 RepID=A0A927CL39_9BACL|nr:hypothetical protein [Paenibacillus arenilitoris]MBD2868161.1 hypothetical protein [Paenibacillus arenilitoris]
MANQAIQKKKSTYRESIKSTPGQPSVTAEFSQRPASPAGLLQLQRSAGNRAAQSVLQMAGGEAKSEVGSQAITSWLKSEAAKDKKTDLFAFFEGLSPMTQKIAVNLFAGGSGAPSLAKAKKNMTGLLGFSVDWDKFSTIVRTLQGKDTKNYNEDTERDYVTYAATGAAASVGASSAAATSVSEAQSLFGASNEGALGAVTDLGPASAALSGITSGMQIYNAAQNHDAALGTHDKAQNIVAEGGGGVADLARFGATGVVNTQKFLGAATSTAATAAAGAAGVAGGAAYMVSGIAGAYTHNKRMGNLTEIEKNAAGKDEQLGLAAGIGASTQRLNRNKSAATAVKGAAMIVGGGLLLASAATPVGWLLLGAAGAIGGVAAVYKFYKKRARKEEVVDRFLRVDDKLAEMQAADPQAKPDRAKVRATLLQKRGFNSVAQCYSQIITDLAHTIHKKGVIGSEPEYVSLIRNIGLTADAAKGTPKVELIAKKLHT